LAQKFLRCPPFPISKSALQWWLTRTVVGEEQNAECAVPLAGCSWTRLRRRLPCSVRSPVNFSPIEDSCCAPSLLSRTVWSLATRPLSRTRECSLIELLYADGDGGRQAARRVRAAAHRHSPLPRADHSPSSSLASDHGVVRVAGRALP
jgi:hypothetical protein